MEVQYNRLHGIDISKLKLNGIIGFIGGGGGLIITIYYTSIAPTRLKQN